MPVFAGPAKIHAAGDNQPFGEVSPIFSAAAWWGGTAADYCPVAYNALMCGRITQVRSYIAYAREMGWDVDDFGRPVGDHPANWNIPPGTSPYMMHTFGDGKGHIDAVHWGYRPNWAVEKGLPPAINARIEKAATGAFFRPLWKSGRASCGALDG